MLDGLTLGSPGVKQYHQATPVITVSDSPSKVLTSHNRYVAKAGKSVDGTLLQYLSPLGWKHINLTSDHKVMPLITPGPITFASASSQSSWQNI